MLQFSLFAAKFSVNLSQLLIFPPHSLKGAGAVSLLHPLGEEKRGEMFLRPNTRLPPFNDRLQTWVQGPRPYVLRGEVIPQQKEVAS